MKKSVLFVLLIFFTLPIYAMKMRPLSGIELKKLVTNKLILIHYANRHLSGINLNTTGNNLIVATYADGSMHGIFARSNATNGTAVMDTGRWYIKNNKEVCEHWDDWENNRVVCVYWFAYDNKYVLLHSDRRLAGIVNKDDIV